MIYQKFRFFTSIMLFTICMISCRNENDKPIEIVKPVQPAPSELNATVKTFPSESGWGYDIYVGEEKYIHQPFIPVIEGNHPFKTEEEALRVGELMIQKIQGNIVPPGITREELQLLEIQME